MYLNELLLIVKSLKPGPGTLFMCVAVVMVTRLCFACSCVVTWRRCSLPPSTSSTPGRPRGWRGGETVAMALVAMDTTLLTCDKSRSGCLKQFMTL